MDPGPRPTNADMAQLIAMLQERGLIEVSTDDQGREAYRLTEEGVRVGNMLAMVGGEDADKVLAALLGTAEPQPHTIAPSWRQHSPQSRPLGTGVCGSTDLPAARCEVVVSIVDIVDLGPAVLYYELVRDDGIIWASTTADRVLHVDPSVPSP